GGQRLRPGIGGTPELAALDLDHVRVAKGVAVLHYPGSPAAARERLDLVVQPGLEVDGVGRVIGGDRSQGPAGGADGGGDVEAVVDNAGQQLGVDLGLGVAAHGPVQQPRSSVVNDH